MLLDEKGIEQFIEEMKSKKLNIDELKFRYNPDNPKPYALVTGNGISDIEQDEDYYVNFLENIIASDFSWFGPVCKELKTFVEASISVMPDGNFETQNISLDAKIDIPQTVDNVFRFLYPRFKSFVLFYPYIKQIKVRGFEGKLSQVRFFLSIDAKPVSRILKDKTKINKSILEQWLYVMEKSERDNAKKKQHFENVFKVSNGKINYQTRTELVAYHFTLTKEEVTK